MLCSPSFESSDLMDLSETELDGQVRPGPRPTHPWTYLPRLLSPGAPQVLAEYVWLGGSGADLRSTTKVLESRPETHEDCPVITVDGSLCGQGSGPACELFLKPRKLFKDPFRGGEHLLVLCDSFTVNEVSRRSAVVLGDRRCRCRCCCTRRAPGGVAADPGPAAPMRARITPRCGLPTWIAPVRCGRVRLAPREGPRCRQLR
jgi:hypothetical protein